MSKVLLKKDQRKIDSANYELRHNLAECQKYLDWYHSIDFNEPLHGIEAVKEFLANPHHIYEIQVKKHLTELTGLKTLPPDIEQLKTMYQIPAPQAWRVSDKFGFEYLQIDESGRLSYSQEIYDITEAENTVYATDEQATALQELARTWDNLQTIKKAFSKGSVDNLIWDKKISEIFDGLQKPYTLKGNDTGNQTPWDLEKLERLANAGFGKKSNNK